LNREGARQLQHVEISYCPSPTAHRPLPTVNHPPARPPPIAHRPSHSTAIIIDPSEEGMRQFSWPQFRFTDKIPNETECNEPSSTPEIRVQSAAFLTEGCKFCMAARSSHLNNRFTSITTKQSYIRIFSCVWVFHPGFK
jgi:hypothetical protein